SRLSRAAAAEGLLELGGGRPDEAIPYLEEVRAHQEEQGWSDASVTPHVTPDLVEAYAGAGRLGDAHSALAAFASEAERTGRPSALAAAARCRGLLACDADIDSRFAEALRFGEDVTGPFEHARSRLLHATRLVRAGRGSEAREPLEAALAAFERLGASPWAGRAHEQLLLAGVPASPRNRSPLELLTPRELEVALAVAAGASAREAASRLFLGPRTAQFRLVSALVKLGLDSPAELGAVVGAEAT